MKDYRNNRSKAGRDDRGRGLVKYLEGTKPRSNNDDDRSRMSFAGKTATQLVVCTLIFGAALVLRGADSPAAVVHETGHIAAIALSKDRIRAAEVTALGLMIERDGYTSYYRDMAIAATGPLLNVVWFVMSYALWTYFPESQFLSLFCGMNVILCLLNLIPVLPLDGGVVTRSYLLMRCEITRAQRLGSFISFGASALLFIMGCVLLYATRYNVSLLLVSLFLFGSLGLGEKIA